MKIFVLEYACAGGPASEPFLEEGRTMLRALLGDLEKADGTSVSTLVAPATDLHHRNVAHLPRGSDDFFTDVEHCFAAADAVWVIAPESGGIHERLVRAAERHGKPLLASSARTVAVCADKLTLPQLLKGAVTMPHTEPLHAGIDSFPCVVKPRRGAGCEGVFYVESDRALAALQLTEEEYIVQQYIPGDTLSAGVLTCNGSTRLLGVCRQAMTRGPNLRLETIEGPVVYVNEALLKEAIGAIASCLPGLNGYWGIDFIDGGGGPVVIEINPRLTASYPRYAKSSGLNIARDVVRSLLSLPPAH